MRAIWKFEFEIADLVELKMPKGAKIIRIGKQKGQPVGHVCLWAIVDTTAPTEPRLLDVRGTGHSLKDVGKYLGTVDDHEFVWHVFE